MPYKDLERKKEWERQHRAERSARRRELRQIAADQGTTRTVPGNQESGGGGDFLIPMIAGGALTAYSPKLGIGAGGLTLVAAAVWKKSWVWWFVGCVVLLIGLLFYFTENEKPDDPVGSGAQA